MIREKFSSSRALQPSPKRERRPRSTAEAVSALFQQLGGQDQGRLTALWKNWDSIMDDTVRSLGYPLGHKDSALLIGADDNMAVQELSLLSADILERANAFMGQPFFTRVRVTLTQGRPDLTRPRAPAQPPQQEPERHFPRLGRLLGKLDPDSPVTRCYEAFADLARRKK